MIICLTLQSILEKKLIQLKHFFYSNKKQMYKKNIACNTITIHLQKLIAYSKTRCHKKYLKNLSIYFEKKKCLSIQEMATQDPSRH